MKFADIPGHRRVKERLREMVLADRLPHALLLEGPEGTGKLALARAFAQFNNCTARTPDGEPCGKCPACLQSEHFNHVDTIYSFPIIKPDGVTDPVSDDFFAEWRQFLTDDPFADYQTWTSRLGKDNAVPYIYVSEANSLIHRLNFQSRVSRYRTVILWLPERMREETANKLLKMIEEPYPDTLIIMVSNAPEDILGTIYSRLQRISVGRLSDDEVAGWLTSTQGVGEEDALAVAHIAEGNLTAARRAISVSKESARRLESFKALMRSAYQRDIAALKAWSQDIAATGRERTLQFYDYCLRLVRESFMLNFQRPELTFITTAEREFLRNFAPFINTRNVEKMVEVLEKAREDIRGNANGKIVNFDLAVKMILLIKQ